MISISKAEHLPSFETEAGGTRKWPIWEKISNTRKLRKNSELKVRIELTILRILVRTP